jgi:Domain of unknown function (DUF4111)/Nucleotidyltransferase domain
MSQHGWHNCPDPIRNQVNSLVDGCRQMIGENLIGVYLHGSLATGCHNPERSDIDLLLVTERGMAVEVKRALAELFIQHEGQPRQLEVSSLTWAQLHPLQYPVPYDFHNGTWVEGDLASGAWRQWNDAVGTDPDLAAHLTMVRQRGLVLFGRPIADVFPAVPAEYYRDSMLLDFDWGLERIAQRPMYFVLNACRIAAYLQEGAVLSKDEGGEWGLRHAPEAVKGVVQAALAVYRGEVKASALEGVEMGGFVGWATGVIKSSQM